MSNRVTNEEIEAYLEMREEDANKTWHIMIASFVAGFVLGAWWL